MEPGVSVPQQGSGASSLREDRATHEPSQQAVSAVPVGIPSADWLPVITMWQPWASLLMARRKLYETRSFKPPSKYIGQRIFIHAAAKLPSERNFSQELLDLCYDEFGCGWNYSLPRGCILGTARIGSVVSSNDLFSQSIFAAHPDEEAAGDWSPNRFGWWMWDVEPLAIPIPAKGKQGWWRFPAQGMSPETAETGTGSGPKDGQPGPPTGGCAQ